jgi:micrococcal nuclease
LSALIVLIFADRSGWLLVRPSDEWVRYDGHSFGVARVIDGDTIEIEAYDAQQRRPTTRVRLWGIDSPEVAHPGFPQAEPFGEDATEYVKTILNGGTVTVHLETSRVRDKYDRLLAHLDLPDGRRMNVLLLEAGLARADDRWPHHELARYDEAEREAKAAHRGLWGAQ